MLEIQIRLLLGSGLTRLERVGNGSGACAVQSRVYDYNIFLMSLARLTQPNTINVDYAQYIVWRMMIIIISIEAPTREEDEHEDENRFTSAGSLAHYDDTRRRCLLTLLFNSLRILCIYDFSFFFCLFAASSSLPCVCFYCYFIATRRFRTGDRTKRFLINHNARTTTTDDDGGDEEVEENIWTKTQEQDGEPRSSWADEPERENLYGEHRTRTVWKIE